MSDGKFPDAITAAFLRESCSLKVDPQFMDVTLGESVPFTRCERQGGTESTWKWDLCMGSLLSRLVAAWRGNGYGMVLNGFHMCCLVFADNIWLISHELKHIWHMTQMLARVMEQNKLYLKPDSLEWLGSIEGLS